MSDDQDSTSALGRPCEVCGHDAATVDLPEVGAAIRENAEAWQLVLSGPGSRRRRGSATWSVAEQAAQVSDVHQVFAGRLAAVLEAAGPEPAQLADLDPDAAVPDVRHDLVAPEDVGRTLAGRAAAVAAACDAVEPTAYDLVGLRSNGSAVSIRTLARHHLHDVVHHLWDVRRELTVASYEAGAQAYRSASSVMSEHGAAAVRELVSRLEEGSRVLEIGSGAGRDARALEEAGLSVRRTDITPGFVELLRADGHRADVVDPLVDDLRDPVDVDRFYDGVWANACLLHVARGDLPLVLARLASVTRPGGALRLSLKEGDGEAWSTHGSIDGRRMFTYWRIDAVRAVLAAAGWSVEATTRDAGLRGETWLGVLAGR